ncbi:hypothetical protein V2J09_020477 [Rumex salicifolius]
MSSNSGANARVSIPSNVRKTIQNIKEIGVNHSDEDVYAMLKDCNMDPNETVQRLLFLDTFHEVKSKRDKKKENVNGRVFDDLRRKVTNQVRGARSSRGSYSSQYASHDAGSGMKAVVRKENGYEDRGRALHSPARLALPVLKELDSRTSKLIEKISPATVKDPTELSNGIVIAGDDKKNSGSIDTVLQKDDKNADPVKIELTLTESEGNTEPQPSASEPLLNLKQPCNSQLPTGVVAIKGEVKSLQTAIEMKDSFCAEAELESSHEPIVQKLKKNQHARSENSELINIDQPEINGDILVSEELSTALIYDKSSAANSLVNALGPTKAVEDSTSKHEKLKFSEDQHVILPNHIQVPDAVKNVLSFGSLGSCFSVGLNNIVSSDSNGNSNQDSNLVEDGKSNEASEDDEDTPSSADEENYSDPPPAQEAETIMPAESKNPALKDEQPKQEAFPGAIPQHALIQTPAYNFGFMPPLLGNSPIPLEGHDHQHQMHLSNYTNGTSIAMSTSAPTPPPAQSPGSIQSSVVVSVQPVPLLRQPYPPNFIPYAHYLSPYFVPPTLQFVGHGAFPPPLPNGNMYMAPAATPGMKASPPYKLGTNVTNQTPFPIPSGAYAVINSPQVGVSNANDDLVASMLKENTVYLGQQNSTNMPINSFFNLPPQGQHIALTPQPGHTAYAAMYHPALQTVAAPLLQPGQSMAGPVDPVGLPQPPQPPPNAFQQPPQRHQMNWNNTF